MSCIVDSVSLLSGACVVSAYRGHGVPGSEVPSTGEDAPSPVFNDLRPGDSAKEYRIVIKTPPSAGTLYVNDNTSYVYSPTTVTANQSDAFVYELWEDGFKLTPDATEVINIGAGGALVLVPAASISGSVVPPGTILIVPDLGGRIATEPLRSTLTGSVLENETIDWVAVIRVADCVQVAAIQNASPNGVGVLTVQHPDIEPGELYMLLLYNLADNARYRGAEAFIATS